MLNPPTYRKINPADAPIFYLALTSDNLSLTELDYYANTVLAQSFSMIEGVAQVSVFGSQTYAVRIQLNPISMAAYQISLEDVSNAISNNNAHNPTGAIYGKNIYSTIYLD